MRILYIYTRYHIKSYIFSLCSNISCIFIYTVCKLKCPSPLTFFGPSAASRFFKSPSAPLDHQSCSLTCPEAFVFRLPPGRVSRFYPKSFNENRVVAETSLAFQWFHQPFLRISGSLRLDFECKASQGSCQEHCLEVTLSEIPESARRLGDQQRTKTSSTNSAEDRFTPKFFRTCGPCYVIVQVLQWLRLGIQTNSRDAVICIA